MREKTLQITRRVDGIAVITLDAPGSSVNTLSAAFLTDLEAAVEQVSADRSVRGCVLVSAKAGCFVAGADLDEIGSV
ncbi:MAG TPA: enoyl-CoA hydratase-related protein, partial [Bdellovibrionota bacterium]|nr:enoyl-CoA hydratase-related protein [Bdellovibrionota bacterium]